MVVEEKKTGGPSKTVLGIVGGGSALDAIRELNSLQLLLQLFFENRSWTRRKGRRQNDEICRFIYLNHHHRNCDNKLPQIY